MIKIRNAALILALALAAGSTVLSVRQARQTWSPWRVTNLLYVPSGRPLARDIRTLEWRPNQDSVLMEIRRIRQAYPPMT